MITKDWYKITFQIESNLEDLIIWKFNELGISSYAFEYVLNSENKKKVYLWIPTSSWDEISINNLEIMINENIALAYDNVIVKSENSLIKAQTISLDLITKDIEINSKNKIKIRSEEN